MTRRHSDDLNPSIGVLTSVGIGAMMWIALALWCWL